MVWLCVLIAVLALAFFGRDSLRSLAMRSTPRARAPRPAADSLPGLSAHALLDDCERLARGGATWSDIATALNPEGDSHVDGLLGRIRAANMGEPLPILKAIEAGCRAALAENDAATAFDALSVAARNSLWTSSAKL